MYIDLCLYMYLYVSGTTIYIYIMVYIYIKQATSSHWCLQLLCITSWIILAPPSYIQYPPTWTVREPSITHWFKYSILVHMYSKITTVNPQPRGKHLYQLEYSAYVQGPLLESYKFHSFLKLLNSALASPQPLIGCIFSRERKQEIISW